MLIYHTKIDKIVKLLGKINLILLPSKVIEEDVRGQVIREDIGWQIPVQIFIQNTIIKQRDYIFNNFNSTT